MSQEARVLFRNLRRTHDSCFVHHDSTKVSHMKIPTEISQIITALESHDYEAFLVGGCVRDVVLGKTPKDWDITTNAKPEDIQRLFPEHVYENTFGTVAVKTSSDDASLALVEVTPYRTESTYTDKRHPDKVQFADRLEDDLSRRDFTINAMAARMKDGKIAEIIDLHEGKKDLNAKTIRAVGDPNERMEEDALRMLRAVRFACELGFTIDKATAEAITTHAASLKDISAERIRDELTKMICSALAGSGIETLRALGLIEYILPELLEGYNVGQNLHHIYTIWEHNVRALECAVENDWSLVVRLAALLHDVGKPRTKKGDGKYSTFYAHDVVGARMAKTILKRLKFSNDIIERVTLLVRWHLFYYNVDEVTDSSVRRLIKNVGPENMDDLINVRICDRIGSGVPKAEPYKLRHFRFMVEKLQRDPISVGMLNIDGKRLMEVTELPPSPKVGQLLAIMLEDVLDDPTRNTAEYLESRAQELANMSDEALKGLSARAKETSQHVESEEVTKLKSRHHVQ